MSVSTGDSLLRQCVLTLDAIYSSFDCSEYIKTLVLIERKLFDKHFNNLESFRQELITIPGVTTEFIESINLKYVLYVVIFKNIFVNDLYLELMTKCQKSIVPHQSTLLFMCTNKGKKKDERNLTF